ncbi:MAG TPA: GNAT family N-acetyltransferase [Bradyrhizobium sp.]|uniref:GNAT family N-acetyltransferase n=1 Tax=Bradyrhizobium sp. TaxID=376 RepID=UPI002C98C359|nr:GNAT family N-acetyltransferase [Bradyrhizobium sp.]HLZ06445.1 GNAT family N-acetyltransferase [Bradyrhizobium sp.]
MTIAAAIESRADAPARSRSSRIARVDLISDLGAVETIWRELETRQLATPYQRFDLLSTWLADVGQREGALPCIVTARDDADDRPLFLLPLVLRRHHGVRIASFMGGKHTSFNMALWDKDFAREATGADLAALLAGLRAHNAVDVLALTQQPRHWQDQLNPLAMLPKQRSVNDCPVLTMVPDDPPTNRISNSFRRRLKSKERKLQAPGYRYYVVNNETDIERLLNWFFRVKPMRMAEQKLPDVFAEPGVADFVRKCCHTRLPGGGHLIDIHALECDDEVIAIFAGVADGHRFSMMFNTYTMSGRSRYSPGLILMRHIIDHYGERRYRALDLGVGSDDYKRLFCKGDEPIFDSFIALTSRGKLAAMAMSGLNRTKRLVKHNGFLLGLAQRLRRTFR